MKKTKSSILSSRILKVVLFLLVMFSVEICIFPVRACSQTLYYFNKYAVAIDEQMMCGLIDNSSTQSIHSGYLALLNNYDVVRLNFQSDDKCNFPINFVLNRILGNIVLCSMEKKILCIFVFIVLTVALLYFIYYYRGNSRKYDVKLTVMPSQNRFMDINDMYVVNCDCWYWEPNSSFSITVNAKIIPCFKRFARKVDIKDLPISIQVDDIDNIEFFSFRPTGFAGEGDILHCAKEYPCSELNLSITEDGRFSFGITAYLNEEYYPDRIEEVFADNNNNNVLKMSVDVFVRNKNKRIIGEAEESYQLIVKEKKGICTDMWVALDPGTTGSCIAIGKKGFPSDTNDILLVKNSFEEGSVIFPSVIQIPKKSHLFDDDFECDNAEENSDYFFGNKAEQYAGDGNVFQSIKKLLGYHTDQIIIKDEKKQHISGQDLAYLLVKGLYHRVSDYIFSGKKECQVFAERESLPDRAIVAVPNNYTPNKIQDMVNTIKRLNKFREVHFIYESEAVMMSYLRRKWAGLRVDENNKIFVVFDMGGATINATAFRLEVCKDVNMGVEYTKNIEVRTISKVGYCIGGDDIDYAIIQALYGMQCVKNEIEKRGIEINVHQMNHKQLLIKIARDIKMDIVRKTIGENVETLSRDGLRTKLNPALENLFGSNIDLDDEDVNFLMRELPMNTDRKDNSLLSQYVFRYIKESVKELCDGISNTEKQVFEVIFSGRTTMFPYIREDVLKQIKDTTGRTAIECREYKIENLNIDDVKSIVAQGACWYALYSDKIKIVHDIVTSSIGYVDLINGVQTFHSLIDRNVRFNPNGVYESKKEPPIDPTLQQVRFVQMLGGNTIVEDNIKCIRLATLSSDEINDTIKNISMTVDISNNFNYTVSLQNGTVVDRTQIVELNADITDETSLAFHFAAYTPIENNVNNNSSMRRISKSTRDRNNSCMINETQTNNIRIHI